MIVSLSAGLALGIASAAHCAGMCGPLAALACRRGGRGGKASWANYLGGRLLGYAAAGALLGGFSQVALTWLGSPWLGAVASWTLALSLGVSAWWLWQGGPAAASPLVTLRRPASQGGWLRRFTERLTRWPAALVGAGQTLLPCGALAAAWMSAAGQGTALGGAATMAGFATASSVGLLLPGLAGRWMSGVRHGLAVRGFAVVLAVGAVWLVVRPMSALRSADGPHGPSCPMHAAEAEPAS